MHPQRKAVRFRQWLGECLLVIGILLACPTLARCAQSVTLEWDASPDSDIAGYRIRYGTASGTYTQVKEAGVNTSTTVDELASGSTYYFVATAFNAAGVESLPSNEVSFTAPKDVPPYIWPATAAPVMVDGGADKPVELGVKFRSDVAGVITGIRFYKASTNTGTHVGSLWTSTGTRLAFATFDSESASGWQQVSFSSPVSIQANTVYVASYHCPAGHYSADENYFATSGIDSPPLHALANGVSGGNGVYRYGSAGTFPNQTWNASHYWVDVVFEPATTSSLSLKSIAVTPQSPTVLVGNTQKFTATGTFSNASTQDLTSQVTWTSSNNNVASISAGGLATAVGAGTTTITATSGGFSGSSTLTVEGTTASIGTIWPATAAPVVVDGGADKPVELGVKFRSDVAGVITGIRFYKASTNTGTHVGSLWTSTGTRLRFVTFDSESASGWQQVSFSSPVSIQANTVYVASYHCPAGHYSADENYFATSGIDSPPLHALANGVSGGNGVYRYGSAGTFPNQTWNASHYWVDVVFQANSGTNVSLPTITSVLPQPGVSGVALQPVVKAVFNESLDASTINASTVFLRNSANTLVSTTVGYNSADRTISLTPITPLPVASVYTATVKGGASGVADLNGNRLAADYSWSFTTTTYGALGGGPGGPVLVITDESNPFSQYYAEILLAEGLNHFAIKDIDEVSSSTLAGVDAVILGSIPLSTAQVTMLSDWVNGGGNLIAMRPDKKLASLLGLVDTNSTLSEGYLRINNSSGPGVGIVGETIQFHGTADRYTLAGATPVATLFSNATAATANPAVTLRDVGSNGGQAAAFTFDLARSIVLMRQGNPAWAGQERDGSTPLRASDLFYGAASVDVQPDWINLDKVAIPQADEQQRLLANMILIMSADRNLLPRFWYFPHGYEAAVVMTGDDQFSDGTKGRFDSEIALSSASGSVEDWEYIRSTSYIFANDGALTDTEAAAYTASGFELALELNTNCTNFTADQLDAYFTQQLAQWRARYPSLASPVTNRTNCMAWSGYTITPEISAKYGIRLDTNYGFWPADWVLNRPGFMTGSGMPMRFSTAEGQVVDVYQAATQMSDDSGQAYPFTSDQLLGRALGPEKYYGAFVANMRTNWEDVVLSAIDRGVPVISARQLLTWIDGRNSSSIVAVQTNSESVRFQIKADAGARGLQVMVPLPDRVGVGGVTCNGSAAPYALRVVKGIQYAFIDALNGTYEVRFGADSIAPTVTTVQPSSGATGVARNAPIQVGFSEPIEIASLSTSNLTLRDASNTAVPVTISYNGATSTAILTPTTLLAPGASYTLTVRGGTGGVADLAGNTLTTNFVASFTTASIPTGNQSLWTNSTAPANVTVNDAKAVEVGLKFQSKNNGVIKGVRFYKGPTNTGTHTGNLWTSNGTLLGSVTFSAETASGWQYQAFTNPVPITANTTYVVSYHSPQGVYSETGAYFGSSGFENGSLRALSNSEAGGNGVYRYGTSAFPNNTFNATNYWVDVVFEATP